LKELKGLPAAILFILGIVAGALYGEPQNKRKREEFNARMDEWRASWICLRCGATWAAQATGSAAAI
jgi:hypothetical protein